MLIEAWASYPFSFENDRERASQGKDVEFNWIGKEMVNTTYERRYIIEEG